MSLLGGTGIDFLDAFEQLFAEHADEPRWDSPEYYGNHLGDLMDQILMPAWSSPAEYEAWKHLAIEDAARKPQQARRVAQRPTRSMFRVVK